MISSRRGGRVVRQRPAKPRTPVRIRSAPLGRSERDFAERIDSGGVFPLPRGRGRGRSRRPQWRGARRGRSSSNRLVPECSGEGLETSAVPEPAGGEGVPTDVGAAVGDAGALAAAAPPACEGRFADRALAVEAGLAELVGLGRVPEVIPGGEGLVDGERQDLLDEGRRADDAARRPRIPGEPVSGRR